MQPSTRDAPGFRIADATLTRLNTPAISQSFDGTGVFSWKSRPRHSTAKLVDQLGNEKQSRVSSAALPDVRVAGSFQYSGTLIARGADVRMCEGFRTRSRPVMPTWRSR